jgi:hypothetical protein
MAHDITPEVQLYLQEHADDFGRIARNIRSLDGSPATVVIAITLRLDGGSAIDALTIDVDVMRRASRGLAEFYESQRRDLRADGDSWLVMAQREGRHGLWFGIVRIEDMVLS